MAIDSLPTWTAPDGGELTDEMLAAYRDTGVIILEDFVDVASCRRLMDRARELIDAFDPSDVASVFSTTENEQLDDRYFIESGDKIRFFLEADAFDDKGQLLQSKEASLNKMGHAMHDLDPEFDAFSRGPALAEIGRRLGFELKATNFIFSGNLARQNHLQCDRTAETDLLGSVNNSHSAPGDFVN